MTFFHELDIIEVANVVVEVGISLRKLQQIQMNSYLHQMQITLSKYLGISIRKVLQFLKMCVKL